jgi:hypothetical protein
MVWNDAEWLTPRAFCKVHAWSSHERAFTNDRGYFGGCFVAPACEG